MVAIRELDSLPATPFFMAVAGCLVYLGAVSLIAPAAVAETLRLLRQLRGTPPAR